MKKKQFSNLIASLKVRSLMTNLGTVTGLTLGFGGPKHESHGIRNRQ